MDYNIYSWNVNGIRAAARKNLLRWIDDTDIDVLCLQETKANREQVGEEIHSPKNLISHWHRGIRKGYSGVATFHRDDLSVTHETQLGEQEFDNEGRLIISKFKHFTLLNCYFPNGKKDQERLDYKMRFYDRFLELVLQLREQGERIVICGDVNTAHHEIDLAHPKPNSKYSGFLPFEREWITKLLSRGFIDTMRHLNPDKPGLYTWWTVRSNARERNVGWRIDYFFIDEELSSNLRKAEIHSDVKGSDHCPISIVLSF